MSETRGARAKLIREKLGLDQDQMAAVLTAEAERAGIPKRYDRTAISKLEKGRRDVSLDDAVVYAAVDPERRGMAWLATGPAKAVPPAVVTTGRGRGRIVTPEELEPHRAKPAPKKAGGRG